MKMKTKIKMNVSCMLVFLLGIALPLYATTYYVSDVSGDDNADGTSWQTATKTIGVALAKTANSDTVVVTNGTYTLTNQLTVTKNKITLKSVNGSGVTFINGNYPNTTNRCIQLGGGAVWPDSVLTGFTITNGYGTSGGGVWGVYCIITDCVVSHNVATEEGGGIFANGSLAVVSNCTVSYNTAGTYGGGIWNQQGKTYNCTIVSNAAVEGGGQYGGTYIRDCRIVGNTATNGLTKSGGGIRFLYVNSTVENCLVAENVAEYGGGVFSVSTLANPRINTFNSCTFVGNVATTHGDGVFAQGGNAPAGSYVFNNSIIYGNQISDEIYVQNNTSVELYNSCTPQTNGWLVNVAVTTNQPMFRKDADGNYLLTGASPCIDKGANQSWMTKALDLAGNLRIYNGLVDMGAYEFWPKGTCIFIR